MAPTVELEVVELYIWNHFQAVKAGKPLIGGKLYTYMPGSTSTPKAAYHDAWLTVPHENPIILDSEGSADIHLSGTYLLRLYDPEDVLLWEKDFFAFDSSAPPPAPGDKIMGSADVTVTTTPGASVISIPSLVPLGFRVEGLTFTITQSFGQSGGLTGLRLGDAVAGDRWAAFDTLTAGTTGGQVNFGSESQPIAALPYVVLLAATGGTFDATGAMHVTAYFSALPADTVP